MLHLIHLEAASDLMMKRIIMPKQRLAYLKIVHGKS